MLCITKCREVTEDKDTKDILYRSVLIKWHERKDERADGERKAQGWLRTSSGWWMTGERADEKTARVAVLVWRQCIPKVQGSSLPTPSSCSPSAHLLPWQRSYSLNCTLSGVDKGVRFVCMLFFFSCFMCWEICPAFLKPIDILLNSKEWSYILG